MAAKVVTKRRKVNINKKMANKFIKQAIDIVNNKKYWICNAEVSLSNIGTTMGPDDHNECEILVHDNGLRQLTLKIYYRDPIK